MSCAVIRARHNQTDAEKPPEPKTQPPADAELWKFLNRPHHTKNTGDKAANPSLLSEKNR